MSRTKHTVPRRIRAAKRLRAPYEPRGYADQSSRHLLARALKESGIVPDAVSVSDRDRGPVPLPRLIVKRPRNGYFHPASKAEILELLRFFGEECIYGLRTIELLQTGRAYRGGDILFGTLLVPSRIVLYEQPFSPWLLPGGLSSEEQQKVSRAGARVESISETTQTIVSWPGDTLRDFMLFDVLMHEIGHHLLQHHKGKRRERVARTADHEALAVRFAVRCRLLFRSSGEASQ
jgi:hypothetical protein